MSDLGTFEFVQIDQCGNEDEITQSLDRRAQQGFGEPLARVVSTTVTKHDRYEGSDLPLNCDKSGAGEFILLVYGKNF